MRVFSIIPLFLCVFSAAAPPIIVDHTSVSQFDGIPDTTLTRAAALRMMLRHASIGDVLNNGLECLQGTRTSPEECTTFPDYQYDRRNWDFQNRGNPAWLDKIRDFTAQVDSQQSMFDVFAFKFCFIDYASIPCNALQRFDSMRVYYSALETRYPLKTFVWWTVPPTRSYGVQCGEDWNNLIRSYARDSGKILFDLADLETHDSLGNPVTDTAGLEIAWQTWCGEQQVDGMSCHPNWDGSLWICKALWVLMARIAETTAFNGIEGKAVFGSSALSLIHRISIYGQRLRILANPGGDEGYAVNIIDINGRKIFSDAGKKWGAGQNVLSYDLTGFPAGVLFVQFIQGPIMEVRKVVLLR